MSSSLCSFPVESFWSLCLYAAHLIAPSAAPLPFTSLSSAVQGLLEAHTYQIQIQVLALLEFTKKKKKNTRYILMIAELH